MKWVSQIPYSEFTFEAARSSGPGGQSVNRTNSQVQLRWAPSRSEAFTQEQREILMRKLKLTIEGEVLVRSQEARSQDLNKRECLEKLEALLTQAFFVPKKRVKTKPTYSSKLKRLDSKKTRKELKQGRKKIRFP
ncbi:MAG: aminoacyl-tRNA hydrolase [Proteobacteria bacterium]|jgi:ribosome-associated protein|nr:aminoacyl-tRNA hydrolase [Pseudomonadota bacterium]